MDLLQAAILGFVEGVSEFLPISSTFHMILASKLIGISETEAVKLFQVFIQSGAILAALVLFWKDFLSRTKIRHLILSFVPTAIIGFALHGFIKQTLFEAFFGQIVVFFLVGVIFVATDNKTDVKQKKMSSIDAIIIGFIQALAVLPGVSRSGAVMLAMLFLGYNRFESAKYSFMLAVPTILAAGILDLYKGRRLLISNTDLIPNLTVGSLVAFAVSIIGISWFIGFNQKHGLRPWGYYRIILAIVCLLIGLK